MGARKRTLSNYSRELIMKTLREFANNPALFDKRNFQPVYNHKPYLIINNGKRNPNDKNVPLAFGTKNEMLKHAIDGYYNDHFLEVRKHDLHMNDNTTLEEEFLGKVLHDTQNIAICKNWGMAMPFDIYKENKFENKGFIVDNVAKKTYGWEISSWGEGAINFSCKSFSWDLTTDQRKWIVNEIQSYLEQFQKGAI